MSPKHSIQFCPICGGGLCGVRVCEAKASDGPTSPHGFIICDECEAIWLEPDLSSDHQYPDAVDSRCPICEASLWGSDGRWAEMKEIRQLGWEANVDRDLDRIDEVT